jgi:hypothetical protein
MPQTPHIERHFTGSDTVRDIVIGMSDGLTVPFGLAAGLLGGVGSTGVRLIALIWACGIRPRAPRLREGYACALSR